MMTVKQFKERQEKLMQEKHDLVSKYNDLVVPHLEGKIESIEYKAFYKTRPYRTQEFLIFNGNCFVEITGYSKAELLGALGEVIKWWGTWGEASFKHKRAEAELEFKAICSDKHYITMF